MPSGARKNGPDAVRPEILEQQGEEGRSVLGDEGGGGAEPLRSFGGEGDAGRVTPRRTPADKPAPYLGYFYKILKKQGPNASGGAYDYVVRGKMIGGFALVAHPAAYGVTGIMTFIVNHEGVVFEKDLGKETEKIVSAMNRFDPDQSWKKAE